MNIDRKTSDNTGFSSGGVTWQLIALCFVSSLVLVYSLCSETRPKAKPETVHAERIKN